MRRLDIDSELEQTARASDATSIQITNALKFFIHVKAETEKNNLDKVFYALYFPDKSLTLDEVAAKVGIDSKTLRRKRVQFCTIFKQVKADILSKKYL